MLGATSVLKVDSMQRPCFFLDWGTSLYKNDSCKQLWKQLAVFFRGWWQSRGQAKDVLTFQSTAFLLLFPSYFMQKNLWLRKNPLLTLLLKYFKRALKKGRGWGWNWVSCTSAAESIYHPRTLLFFVGCPKQVLERDVCRMVSVVVVCLECWWGYSGHCCYCINKLYEVFDVCIWSPQRNLY